MRVVVAFVISKCERGRSASFEFRDCMSDEFAKFKVAEMVLVLRALFKIYDVERNRVEPLALS